VSAEPRRVTVAIDAGLVELEGRRMRRRRLERFVDEGEVQHPTRDVARDVARDVRLLRTALRESRLLLPGARHRVDVVWETGAVGLHIGRSHAAGTSVPDRPRDRSQARIEDAVDGSNLGLLTATVPTCCPPGDVCHEPCAAPPLEVILDASAVRQILEALDERRCVGDVRLELGPLVRLRALLRADERGVQGDLIVLDVARAATTILRCSEGALVAIRSAGGCGDEVIARLVADLLKGGEEPRDAPRVVVLGPAVDRHLEAHLQQVVGSAIERMEVHG
jgi:hypothetical protein